MTVTLEDVKSVKFNKGGMYGGVPFKFDGLTYTIQESTKEGLRIVRLKDLQSVVDYIDETKGGKSNVCV